MTDEHTGTCIYDKGRFELRENDNAIIDVKGDFPPIMIASNTVDNDSESEYADKRGVLHLLNELSDNNPNEEKHWYLKKMLDKAWTQYHEQKEENEQLKSRIKDYDVALKKLQDLTDKKLKENEQLKKQKEHLERKIERERTSAMKEHEKWEKEVIELIREQRKFIDDLSKENKQLTLEVETLKQIKPLRKLPKNKFNVLKIDDGDVK